MNLISLTSSEKKKSNPPPTKKTIYRIVPNMYISKKNRQNQSTLLEVSIVFVFKLLKPRIYMRRSFGALFMFYFFISVQVT